MGIPMIMFNCPSRGQAMSGAVGPNWTNLDSDRGGLARGGRVVPQRPVPQGDRCLHLSRSTASELDHLLVLPPAALVRS